MALPTRSALEQNDILTTYAEEWLSRQALNQSWTIHPILDYLLDTKANLGGGKEILVPMKDGYSANGDSFDRGSTINLDHINHLTHSRASWRHVYESAYIDEIDEVEAVGSGAIFQYVEDAMERSMLAIADTVATQICASATGTSPDGSTDIQSIVEAIDATNTLQGWNPATAGQTYFASTETNSIGSFTTNGPATMRTTYNAVTKYKNLGAPTVIFCSDTAIKAYEATGLNLTTLMASGGKQGSADIGIKNLQYKGIPLVYEPHLDALEASLNGVMLWVNTNAVKLVTKPGATWSVTPWTNMLPANKLGKAMVVKFHGQLIVHARRPLAKLTGITL